MSGSDMVPYSKGSLDYNFGSAGDWLGTTVAVSGVNAGLPANSAFPTATGGSSLSAVLVVDNSAFVSVNVANSGTATSAVSKADNRTLASPSYTFVSSS